MKIEANIAPRRDGTVKAEFGKTAYVFSEDQEGRLVCEIGDEEHIAVLLNTGNFIPAEDEDFEIAAALTAQGGNDDGDEDDGDEDDEDDEKKGETLVDPDSIPPAPPVEAKTPPSGRKPRKAAKVS